MSQDVDLSISFFCLFLSSFTLNGCVLLVWLYFLTLNNEEVRTYKQGEDWLKPQGAFLPPLTNCSFRGIDIKIQHLVLLSAFLKQSFLNGKIASCKRCKTWRNNKKIITLDSSFIWPQKRPRGDSALRSVFSKEIISHTKLFPVLWGKTWQEQWPEKEKCKLGI